jgi:hypothetical protein
VVEGATFTGHVTVGPDAAKNAKPMDLDIRSEVKPMAGAPKIEAPKPGEPMKR